MIVRTPSGIHRDLMPVLLEKANNSEIDIISLFSMYTFATQIKYKSYILAVSPSDNTIFKERNQIEEELIETLNEGLREKDTSIKNFASVKYCLDKLFYDITEKGVLNYTYNKTYLISSSQLGAKLNISRATIHRYKELGMESVENVGHHSYPLHNLVYWSDGIWAARIQALYQSFKSRNQSKAELIAEIEKELVLYKKKYGGTFEEVYKDVTDPYQLDEPDDYFDWRDLLEDLKKINE
jgi:hypothetical protein